MIVMEDRNVKTCAKTFFNLETLRSFNVFKVDATKCRGNALYEINYFISSACVDADWETIDSAELFELERFAFHNRHGAFRPNVAKTKNRCSVADNRHCVFTDGEFV